MGYATDISQIKGGQSIITEVFLFAGAVPFVYTNVSQSMMRGKADKCVFICTVNSWNRAFTVPILLRRLRGKILLPLTLGPAAKHPV
ncbi:hypothetical protein K437DRAFT_189416 [Tilletiaria anomala UBC 951]|uniref:Amidase domain-containing protein n=1 Tax=Tilletiaria anomala (strain ATCC 24038 / CBS 436.72 / UBC 951) TaxID=1037660 RepID=A0A066VJF5_TILAU|nr:uncharacterized protein K437DRAFT_189416 [Tilletiaria anomala UBC 951]KDN40438.1 hypothetical protein K437DRAFT_189416 [Tilletiaria anomala UBC 951]